MSSSSGGSSGAAAGRGRGWRSSPVSSAPAADPDALAEVEDALPQDTFSHLEDVLGEILRELRSRHQSRLGGLSRLQLEGAYQEIVRRAKQAGVTVPDALPLRSSARPTARPRIGQPSSALADAHAEWRRARESMRRPLSWFRRYAWTIVLGVLGVILAKILVGWLVHLMERLVPLPGSNQFWMSFVLFGIMLAGFLAAGYSIDSSRRRPVRPYNIPRSPGGSGTGPLRVGDWTQS